MDDTVELDRILVAHAVVNVTMRDGVKLSTSVHLPAHEGVVDPEGRFPAVLIRSPYGGILPAPVPVSRFTANGYAVVIQSVRGIEPSEGVFEPMFNEAWGLRQDGADTVAWIVGQPWSDGKVGTTGQSYLGAVQLLLATMEAPGFETAFVQVPAVGHPGRGLAYNGDVLDLETWGSWSVLMAGPAAINMGSDTQALVMADLGAIGDVSPLEPLPGPLVSGRSLRDLPAARHMPFWQQWLDHRDKPEYFATIDAASRFDRVTKPLMHFSGWYDLFLRNSISAYCGIAERGATEAARHGQRLMIGPWNHLGDPAVRTFPGSDVDDSAASSAWMDHHLRGRTNPIFDIPVILYVMGDNRWRAEEAWPVPGIVPTLYYLHSGGRANGSGGDGSLSTEAPAADEVADHYRCDPANPLPSLRGHSLHGGAVDQQENERRDDVLIYSTPPLEEDVEVTGHIHATIYAASSATDTDWFMKLIDVRPDGVAYNIVEGFARARYRKSRTAPEALTPGEVVEYRLDLCATSNVFKKGHRIRVEVSSSDFPNSDLNPNAYIDISTATAADFVVAEQTVFHDATRPSAIELPVVPRDRARNWIPTPFAAEPGGNAYSWLPRP